MRGGKSAGGNRSSWLPVPIPIPIPIPIPKSSKGNYFQVNSFVRRSRSENARQLRIKSRAPNPQAVGQNQPEFAKGLHHSLMES